MVAAAAVALGHEMPQGTHQVVSVAGAAEAVAVGPIWTAENIQMMITSIKTAPTIGWTRAPTI